MFFDISKVRIFIRPGATDLRCQITGLSIITEQYMKQEPSNGQLYVFCNANKNAIKILHYEKNKFWIHHAKFQSNYVPWPDSDEAAMKITGENLIMLLNCIDVFNTRKEAAS